MTQGNGSAEHIEEPKRGRGRPKKVVPTAAAKEAAGITIPAPEIRLLKVSVEGTSPLIVHRFGAKARRIMLDRQMKKATRGREAKVPEEDYKESLYFLRGSTTKTGFPASGFKNAMVSACTFTEGITKVLSRGAFFVLGDIIPIEGAQPQMREDVVRLQGMGRPADIRFRGEYVPPWSCTLDIRYNARVISAEQIVNLLNIAGFSVGIGEWRPERNGSYGMFVVKSGAAH